MRVETNPDHGLPEVALNQLKSFVKMLLSSSAPPVQPFQSSRSSAVFRLPLPPNDRPVFVKIYTYKRFRQVWRGLLRNTFLGASRAKREWRHAHRLRRLGIDTPRPLVVAERRRLRALRACAIATEWIEPATTIDRFVPAATPGDRRAAIGAVGELAAKMHEGGLVDRDLHPRNVLVQVVAGAPLRVWKIDSPAGRRSRRFRGRARDLASLDVGGCRLVSRTDRWRAWRAYAAHRKIPRAAWRRWLAAIETWRVALDPREGARIAAEGSSVPRAAEKGEAAECNSSFNA